MSLLNDALRNVEKRQRQEQHGVPVSPQLGAAPVPGAAPRRWKWLAMALMVVVAVLVGAGGWSFWRTPVTPVAKAAEVAPAAGPVSPSAMSAADKTAPETVHEQSVARPPVVKEVVAATAAAPKPSAPVSTANAPQATRHHKASEARSVPKPLPPKAVAHRHKAAPADTQPTRIAQAEVSQPVAKTVAPFAVAMQEPAIAAATAASADASPDTAVIRPAKLTPDEQDQALSTRLQTLLERGDDDAAMALFRQTATPGQSWHRSRIALVSGLLSGQRYGAVLDLVPESLSSQSPRLRMLRARALLATSGAPSALAELKKSIPELSDWPDYHTMLATLYQQTGQPAQAATIWGKLLQLDNSRADWWAGLGIALDSERRVAGAREAYRQAMMLSGLNPPLRQYVAQRLSTLSAQENE